MKKIVLLVCCLLILVGCRDSDRQPPASEPSAAQSVDEAVPEDSGYSNPDESSADSLPQIADAVIYRGEVTALRDENGVMALELSQVDGTDFGAPALSVRLTGDTKRGFELDRIEVGDYMEVYYGISTASPAADDDAVDEYSVDAIIVNRLPPATACVFNGVLEDIIPDPGAEQSGQLVLSSRSNGENIAYLYTASTQFYLDFDALSPGDELSVYSDGILADSLPPQGNALEVRFLS